MAERTYYQMLGVSPQATEREIEEAYRKIAAEFFDGDGQYNPDAQKWFFQLNQAYVVLTDPKRRKLYDSALSWEKKGAEESGAAGEVQPALPADEVPEWLKDTEEYQNIIAAPGDVKVPEWMEEMTQEAQDRRAHSGERRTARVFIFISLALFLLLTIAVVLMMLASMR